MVNLNLTHTLACEDRDFPEWHGGCRHAMVWAVDADVSAVRAAVEEARELLADVLLPRYARQPHVTFAYAGLVPSPGARPGEAPCAPGRLASDIAALCRLAARPFTVRLAGWGSFPMVPYLAAEAPELHAAHRAVAAGGYVPHVTLGHYSVSRPLTDIAARVEGWAPPAVEVTVREWLLLAYETHDIAGPLTTLGRLSLDDGTWTLESDLPGLSPCLGAPLDGSAPVPPSR